MADECYAFFPDEDVDERVREVTQWVGLLGGEDRNGTRYVK